MMDDFKTGGQSAQPDLTSKNTRVSNATDDAVGPVPTEPTPPPAPRKTGRVKKWLIGGLFALLLAAAGALAYWQWQAAENYRSEAAMLRTALEAAQEQNQKDQETATQPDRVVTTMELAEAYAEAYKRAGKDVTFFTKVEKTDGDTALVYTKAEIPNAQPTNFILKRVGNTIVAVDSYEATMSKLQAEIVKAVYGIDVTRLGVEVVES